MNGRRARFVITLLVVGVLGACGQIRVVTTEELNESRTSLLPKPANLGFEETRENNLPRSWRVTQANGPFRASVDEEVKRTGRRSARIEFKGTGKAPYPTWGAFNQELRAGPYSNKTLTVTAWIRTAGADSCEVCRKPGHTEKSMPEDPRRGAQVRILTGSETETLVTPLVMGTSGWTRFVAKVKVPALADDIIVAPVLWGRGTAWFDDVAVSAG